jgi:hypothetical protein
VRMPEAIARRVVVSRGPSVSLSGASSETHFFQGCACLTYLHATKLQFETSVLGHDADGVVVQAGSSQGRPGGMRGPPARTMDHRPTPRLKRWWRPKGTSSAADADRERREPVRDGS